MANDRLRAAMDRHRTTIQMVATKTEVDPKTVGRWLGGRVPHPRHRFTVAKMLNEDEDYLWPGAAKPAVDPAGSEITAAYSFRSDIPKTMWWDLITRAERQIDLLGYTLYFLPLEHPNLIDTLREKTENGCRIRAAIADPKSRYVEDRDAEEELALTLTVRINTSLKYFKPLWDLGGFEMRYQEAPLYNSIFRFDDQMLVTPHLYATPGVSAPALHLRRIAPNGLFSRFASHFEGIWMKTKAITPDQPV